MKLAVVALALAVTLGTATSVAARTPLPPTPPVSAALHDDVLRPAAAAGWVRSELYFAIAGEATASSVTPDEALAESRWRAFLDKEVTPRFPDGLTVFDGYGQWLSRGAAAPSRLRSKVLVVLHEDTPQRRADIEAIRLAWKQASGAQSVLWSQQAVAVSF